MLVNRRWVTAAQVAWTAEKERRWASTGAVIPSVLLPSKSASKLYLKA